MTNERDENGLDADGLPEQLSEDVVGDFPAIPSAATKKNRPPRKRHFAVRDSSEVLYADNKDPNVREDLWLKKAVGPFRTKAAAQLFLDVPRLACVADTERMYRMSKELQTSLKA